MKKQVSFKISAGTYEFECWVLITRDTDALERFLREHVDEEFRLDLEEHDGRRGCVFGRHGGLPVIWLPRVPRTPREHGTLAHEMFHVVSYILGTWVQVPLTGDTEEAYTHLMGHLITQFHEKVRRFRR